MDQNSSNMDVSLGQILNSTKVNSSSKKWNLVLCRRYIIVLLFHLKKWGLKMIDEEIKIIINDILCHTRDILKFLKNIKVEKYNPYLDDLIDFALSTEEDIQTIEHYIYELEIKLYDALNGGDIIEK